ncbi:MAG TPA: hypothetical protein VN238_15020 [Solirubrobacteraceae bacterium]|nr:hypothetical protein [Solirubrobacteraceae bacterium]
MPRTKTLTAAALSALALTGVAATSAHADSIAYLKGGDIWLSTGDGSRQFQVTTGGGYSSVTQSEDGTLAGLAGQRIHKLDRLGNVLADFSTPVSDGTDDTKTYGVSHFEGPFDIDLSPDGTKLTYNFYWQQWTNFGSPYGTYYHYLRKGVGISHSDRLTSWEEPGLGNQTGWSDADWYDDDTLLLSHKATTGLMDTAIDDIGTQTSDSTNWFHFDKPDGLQDMRRAVVNRQHTYVAEVADYKGTPHIDVWTMTGEAPAVPNYCLGIGDPVGGSFEHLTWAPDGKRLAYEDGAGISVVVNECQNTKELKLLIPGGTDPDWGPADVPTSRPAKPQPQPQPQPQPAPAQPQAVVDTPRKAKDDRPAGDLVQSISCKRKCTVTGKVTVPSKLAKKLGLRGAMATGTARASKKGKVALKLTPTTAGRKALAKLKGQKLTLRVTIKEGGKTRTVTKKVTLA